MPVLYRCAATAAPVRNKLDFWGTVFLCRNNLRLKSMLSWQVPTSMFTVIIGELSQVEFAETKTNLSTYLLFN